MTESTQKLDPELEALARLVATTLHKRVSSNIWATFMIAVGQYYADCKETR